MMSIRMNILEQETEEVEEEMQEEIPWEDIPTISDTAMLMDMAEDTVMMMHVMR